MEIIYVYTRKRSEFGRPCSFSDRPAKVTVDIPPDPSMASGFVRRNPVDSYVQHTSDMSEHEVRAAHQPSRASWAAALPGSAVQRRKVVVCTHSP